MSVAQLCSDTSEALELLSEQGLHLKPVARLNISVTLPQLKTPGKSISNWEVMEKIKHMIKPDLFTVLKVSKSSLEFIRFEGEVEAKTLLKTLIARLDSKNIKLSGFTEMLKVRAAEAKVHFPSRHDWDSFFRDAKNMSEAKPGERPDTMHLQGLPCRWFATKKDPDKPSEFILRKVFQQFGELRHVDIPMLDPYRGENVTTGAPNFQTFTFGGHLHFSAFVQFLEYMGFVKAMNAFRGMRLLYKSEDGKAYTANIKVEFDKTKHLSDKHIKKRKLERDKLIELETQREERIKKEREEEDRKKEEERQRVQEEECEREKKRSEKLQKREERQRLREERRRQKKEEKKKLAAERELAKKIALEERKILIAHRKLESMRLLTELLDRAKAVKQKQEMERKLMELEDMKRRQLEEEKRKIEEKRRKEEQRERKKAEKLKKQEMALREKVMKNYKMREEQKDLEQRECLRKQFAGKTLKSAVVMPSSTTR
ncbi:A-kinase anchor protein 17A-like [Saccoglossus kowalevskii]|uniref:A-kinase anchor protein 17A-like n=1 Tax=Saccoglossus kowalevskii TaxID=10224 RepID=A0ABM0GQK5_SACKO|nr:PREDICTED: A-kinase anchor protein 17A-like [Saccoglossus kowalevskii]